MLSHLKTYLLTHLSLHWNLNPEFISLRVPVVNEKIMAKVKIKTTKDLISGTLIFNWTEDDDIEAFLEWKFSYFGFGLQYNTVCKKRSWLADFINHFVIKPYFWRTYKPWKILEWTWLRSGSKLIFWGCPTIFVPQFKELISET